MSAAEDVLRLIAPIRNRIKNPDGWHSSPQTDAALTALDVLVARVVELEAALKKLLRHQPLVEPPHYVCSPAKWEAIESARAALAAGAAGEGETP